MELASDTSLIRRTADPLNCETRIDRLTSGLVTPNADFYIRNHFAVPRIDPHSWRLGVRGLVLKPLDLNLPDLLRMPSLTAVVTLECAGNGRSLMRPAVDGEPWGLGAVSTAEWTGVPLAHVLGLAELGRGAREVVFRGADRGSIASGGPARFERSLSIDDAAGSNALIAYHMNGEPLPANHGFPVRLIVPTWYAVASIKWLTEIEVVEHAFEGHFQTHRYMYQWNQGGHLSTEPVRERRVRSVITEPLDGGKVAHGRVEIRGLAWSGDMPVEIVELSVDGGPWLKARLTSEADPFSWRRWEIGIDVSSSGLIELRSRATDRAGNRQPDIADWNRLGYGNNAVQLVSVTATA